MCSVSANSCKSKEKKIDKLTGSQFFFESEFSGLLMQCFHYLVGKTKQLISCPWPSMRIKYNPHETWWPTFGLWIQEHSRSPANFNEIFIHEPVTLSIIVMSDCLIYSLASCRGWMAALKEVTFPAGRNNHSENITLYIHWFLKWAISGKMAKKCDTGPHYFLCTTTCTHALELRTK